MSFLQIFSTVVFILLFSCYKTVSKLFFKNNIFLSFCQGHGLKIIEHPFTGGPGRKNYYLKIG